MMKSHALCHGMCKPWKCVDLGIGLVRLALAIVFIAHGYGKLTHLDGTVAFFASLGLPALFAYLVALGEFFGGLALFLGIFTRFFGWILALIMAGAIIFVKSKMGIANVASYELELVLLLCAIAVAVANSGRYSMGGMMGKKESCCDGGMCKEGVTCKPESACCQNGSCCGGKKCC